MFGGNQRRQGGARGAEGGAPRLGTGAADYLFPVLPTARPAFLSSTPGSSFASADTAELGRDARSNGTEKKPGAGQGGGSPAALRPSASASYLSAFGQRMHHDDSAPLFERRSVEESREQSMADSDHRRELRHLRLQLRESSTQLATAERINEDLEQRLERLARRHVEDVREKDGQLSAMREERDAALEDADRWQKEHDLQVKKRDRALEALRRVEQELYRMHLRKYDVMGAAKSSAAAASSSSSSLDDSRSMMSSANSVSQHSQLPPGFPVPREVSLLVNSPTKRQSVEQNWGLSDKPCKVHGRIGCPCSILAFEANQAAGIESLSEFLGLRAEDAGHTRLGNEAEVVRPSSLPRNIINRTPPMSRAPSRLEASSPGGVSLHGV